MAIGTTRSPKLLKGGLVVYETHEPDAASHVIVFQYNPEQVTRSLEHRAQPSESSDVGGAREDATRALGPPVETINMTVVLNAADQLAIADAGDTVLEHGLNPAIAILEMLLYPPSATVRQNQSLAEVGEVQLSPDQLPLTVLVFGKSRVVPVQLMGFSVTEESFDTHLNPIQVQLTLGMKVLTYMELAAGTQGRDIYVAYQQRKESLAELYEPGGRKAETQGLIPNAS